NAAVTSEHYMVTAGHCIDPNHFNYLWYAGAGSGLRGLPLGENWAVDSSNDGGIIRMDPNFGGTTGGGGGKLIYYGGVDQSGIGTGETTKTVVTMGDNHNDDVVIVSGSYSGQVGRNHITNDQALWLFSEYGVSYVVHG